MNRRSDLKAQKKLFEKWSTVQLGTKIVVTKDDGTELHTTVKGTADLLDGHTAVIWPAGISGCYSLERCRLDKP